MGKLGGFIKNNLRLFVAIGVIVALAYIMLHRGWDVRAVAIITLVIGFIAQVFTGIAALLSMIPLVGPIIVKLFSIPIFWMFGATGKISSVYAIKRGYGRDVISFNLVVLVLLTGIVIGYVLGHLVPVKGYHKTDKDVTVEQKLISKDDVVLGTKEKRE
ncbi:MAG: hypothetical protein ABIJ24_03605 [Nitrospinota bacterium]